MDLFVEIEARYKITFEDKQDIAALMVIVDLAFPMLDIAMRTDQKVDYNVARAYALALRLRERIVP